eukprot:5582918-Alexandrium_andersonii.AAC.1
MTRQGDVQRAEVWARVLALPCLSLRLPGRGLGWFPHLPSFRKGEMAQWAVHPCKPRFISKLRAAIESQGGRLA